jgi:hypothetical protein
MITSAAGDSVLIDTRCGSHSAIRAARNHEVPAVS